MKTCSFEGCQKPSCSKGLCNSHYAQTRKGKALTPLCLRFVPRAVLPHPTDPRALLVQLTHGKVAIIDRADAEAVGAINWTWKKSAKANAEYAVTNLGTGPGRRWCSLHRFLWERWGLPATPQIDHRNTDGLDCRRENLRAATSTQNRCNTGLRSDTRSGVKGVSWHARMGRWHARVCVDKRFNHLGYFERLDEAAAAVADARARLHGEFARTA